MRKTVRTFVAVEIPPEIQSRAGTLINKLQPTSAKVKWVEPEHLHWTLKFLGEVDLRETPAICAAVSRAVAPFKPFDVETLGAGAFPDVTRPRTVWLGMGLGAEQMIAMHDAIDHELEPLGYRAENRRFRPHLTIGRVRQSSPEGILELARLIQQNADYDGGLSSVFEVAVFSSQLDRNGPTYEPLGHAELLGE
jgi:2'-5' RNA ligase